jgi:hypothetical protein
LRRSLSGDKKVIPHETRTDFKQTSVRTEKFLGGHIESISKYAFLSVIFYTMSTLDFSTGGLK